MEKLVTFEKMIEMAAAKRGCGSKIVYCHGIFDFLHIGHIRFLEQARRLGDILAVTVADDVSAAAAGKTEFAARLRAKALASLDCVDWVAVGAPGGPATWLRRLQPDIYVKGSEFLDITDDYQWQQEKEEAADLSIKIVYVDEITFSSTNLINRYLANVLTEMDEYLELFRKRCSKDQLCEALERMSQLKVLVLGDTILDEYQYCEALGKSSKDPMIAMRYLSQDVFAGGVLAIANHLINFAGSVRLVSVLGSENSHQEFIHSQLNSQISTRFEVKQGAPTLVKRRFLDGYSLNKLFEIYVMDESCLPDGQDLALRNELEAEIEDYDLVLAADFGHGMISSQMIGLLVEKAPFLAVNTQANAGNRGFNTIGRYRRADYISLAEHELRLETRNLQGDLRPQMSDLRRRFDCRHFAVTRGRKGCAVIDKRGAFVKIPAFARNVVDRVGSGDAFLAVSSLASTLELPGEILGFLGNVAGSMVVEVLGNKKPVNKVDFIEIIEQLF